MKYKLGSLFDGSGGFPLAGTLCDIEPCWASEVEPYPIAVTRERFPNMKHLGDISKINGGEIEPVDIITFGSPCQDLSVAGKRTGLKHEANGDEETTRSGLFMEAVRIIKEMRKATNGKYPRFALWENVPGAFSSKKGEDFRIVCEELIKVVEPSASMPPVPKNGWPYSDSYVGDGWSLAYRVFDAQYWGVPQRRRRIHLVADFGGECARTVLFERKGVRGYFEESGKPWQTTPTDAQGSTGADDREGESFDGYNGQITGDKSATLGVTCGVSTERNGVIERRAGGLNAVTLANVAATLRAGAGAPKHEQDFIGRLVLERAPSSIKTHPADSSVNLDGSGKEKPVFCPQGNGIDRADTAGCNGKGWKEDTCYTLNTIDRPAVAYVDTTHADDVVRIDNTVPLLQARDFKGGKMVCFRQGSFADYVENEAGTLKASGGDLGGGSENLVVQSPHYIVRRLTPTECARLQGFADWWGRIEPKENLTDDEYRFWLEVRNTHATINGKETKDYTKAQMLTWYNKLYTESAEYKMWGNGIALPPALYVMQGILDVLNAGTMVSETIKSEETAEPTDLSDAPEQIKTEIIKNAELLNESDSEEETTEEEIMGTNNIEHATTENVISFDAVEQLRRLANERKALADLKPDNKCFSDDVRAIEYAVSVLEAVGL